MSVHWEVKTDTGWQPYDPAVSSQIESFHSSGTPNFMVQLHQWSYDINLSKQLQTNTSTGKSRAIRRVASGEHFASGSSATTTSCASSGGFGAAAVPPFVSGGQWECLADSGWVPYNSQSAGLLAAAASAGLGTVMYSARGQSYRCDFAQMTQTNVHTNVVRKIRCVPVGSSGGNGGNGNGGAGGGGFFGLGSMFSSSSSSNSSNSSSSSGVFSPAGPSSSPAAASSCVESSMPNQGFRLTYNMGGGGVDYKVVTAWQELKVGVDYDPEATCPITAELLGEGGRSDPVVRLSCSTPSIPCVFRASTVEQCLATSPCCPACNFRFEIPGPQPSGTMECHLDAHTRCDTGEEPSGDGTWRLRYNFPSGVQHGRMPSPGARYSGTSREAFLPNTEQGREGVELLKRAFRGGHLMMVGTSVTTGQTNTVIWGGIHQKTGPHGGAANHGWPDPTYFTRLAAECANKGITLQSTNTSSDEPGGVSGDGGNSTPVPPTTPSSSASATTSSSIKLSAPEAKFLARLTSEAAAMTTEINAAMRGGDKSKVKSLMGQRKVILEQKKAIENKNLNASLSAPSALPAIAAGPVTGPVTAVTAEADDDDNDDDLAVDDDYVYDYDDDEDDGDDTEDDVSL